MTNDDFFYAFRKKFGRSIVHNYACGRSAVFTLEAYVSSKKKLPFEGFEQQPVTIITRVGDWYVSGTDRFGTKPGYMIPHAWLSCSEEGAFTMIVMYYCNRTKQRKREIKKYTLN